MIIASWNVNSLRVRLPQVLEWLKKSNVDILAIQETKVEDNNYYGSDYFVDPQRFKSFLKLHFSVKNKDN